MQIFQKVYKHQQEQLMLSQVKIYLFVYILALLFFFIAL